MSAFADCLETPAVPPSPPVVAACEATDWNEHAVVDVVTFSPATSLGFEGDRQRVEVYRYRDRAPPLSVYQNRERSFRVTRLTRPLWDRLR